MLVFKYTTITKMDAQLENNYPHATDFALQLTISSGYLELKDFGRLTRVDKFLKSLCEKNIEKYYELLRKCYSTPFIREIIFTPWSDYELPNKFNTLNVYKFNNSDDTFSKNLNEHEMAFYYTYFIFRFHEFYRTNIYSKFWMCILNKKGFIKLFAQDYNFNAENYGFDFKDDIVLKIEMFYCYHIWRNQPKKLNYWGTKIKFENKGDEIYPKFVNLKLLDKLITSATYRNVVSKISIK